MFINKNSKISIVDNTGSTRLRSILFYNNRSGYVGDLHVGSLNRVKAHRKFKKGQVFRAILVQTRRWTYRALGSYIRSLASRAILIKKTEFIPLANRLNGFFFLELNSSGEFKFTSLTVYVALFMSKKFFFKSPKWSFKYSVYSGLENDFFREDSLLFSPLRSCTITYSFYFGKRNVARAIYFVEKLLRVKPKLEFNGSRFKIRVSLSAHNFYRTFNIFIGLLNSDKRKIITQSQEDASSTLVYNVRDLISVFNIMSPSFDYHSWNYATSATFSFKNTNALTRFKNFYL